VRPIPAYPLHFAPIGGKNDYIGVIPPLCSLLHAGQIKEGAVDIQALIGGYETPGWQQRANCMGVDPDLFFPERGSSTREAKEVCRGCVVRVDCLEFAIANGEKFGIWGGMSERERRRVRRARVQQSRGVSAAS
jgi:WhiB family redox-sensing transcriptional regulator